MLHLRNILAAAMLAFSGIVGAQAPTGGDDIAAVLERARQVEHWSDAIRDSLVAPQWLRDGDRLVFWDAVGPHGGTWVLVDAASGRRAPVIDPAALRAQLAALTGKDAAVPEQMPFLLTPDDRGLLFRFDDAPFRVDFMTSAVRRIAEGSIEALRLDGGIPSPPNDRVAIQQGAGFAVIDATGGTVIERQGTSD